MNGSLNAHAVAAVDNLIEDATAKARRLADDLMHRAQEFAADAAALAKISLLPPGVQSAATRIAKELRSESLKIGQQLSHTSKPALRPVN